jgi:hypothetical protein
MYIKQNVKTKTIKVKYISQFAEFSATFGSNSKSKIQVTVNFVLQK